MASNDDQPPGYHQDVDADVDDGWIGSRQEMQNAAEEYRSVMTMLRNKEKANKVPIYHLHAYLVCNGYCG
jgi:hypothetical protein